MLVRSAIKYGFIVYSIGSMLEYGVLHAFSKVFIRCQLHITFRSSQSKFSRQWSCLKLNLFQDAYYYYYYYYYHHHHHHQNLLSGLGMNAIQDLHKLIRLFFKLKIKKKLAITYALKVRTA